MASRAFGAHRSPGASASTPGLYALPPVWRCPRCRRKVRAVGECLVCDVQHRQATPNDAAAARWAQAGKDLCDD